MLRIFLLSTILILSAQGVRLSAQPEDRIGTFYRKAGNEYAQGRFEAAAQSFQDAFSLNRKDDAAAFMSAASYARAGNKTLAVLWLKKLVQLGSCLGPHGEPFAALQKDEDFRKVAIKLDACVSCGPRSTVAFTIPQKDLIPENIAYDPLEKVFYVGSLYRKQIIRIRNFGQTTPEFESLEVPDRDQIYSVLGMKVDPSRRVLLALTSTGPQMIGYSPSLAGRTALLKFDLKSGNLLRSFKSATDSPHGFNDLALTAEGDAYITDSASGEIWKYSRETESIDLFLPGGHLGFPNGIAIAPDGKKLFVADNLLQGIYRVDVSSRAISRLPQRPGIIPYGVDGLYLRGNSLIGIVPLTSGGRVLRFQLDADFESIRRSEVIECNHPSFQFPTTGVLVENLLYYIANSQLQSFQPNGELFPMDRLHETVILKLKL
jgi:sugar lactone lactonase YvrE